MRGARSVCIVLGVAALTVLIRLSTDRGPDEAVRVLPSDGDARSAAPQAGPPAATRPPRREGSALRVLEAPG